MRVWDIIRIYGGFFDGMMNDKLTPHYNPNQILKHSIVTLLSKSKPFKKITCYYTYKSAGEKEFNF